MSRFNGKATQKLYELEKPIKGYEMIIVSVKANGVDGLSASYFVHGTEDGDKPDKELDWDCGEDEYLHDNIVENLVSSNAP